MKKKMKNYDLLYLSKTHEESERGSDLFRPKTK